MTIFLAVFCALGGLALFILGMNIMTEGLRQAAGERLRGVLARVGKRRMLGFGLGTALGTLVQSSAATVMLVGFVNAGLMGLSDTVAPILGANIGTTVSMQAISFHLGAYCYVAISLGFILSVAGPSSRAKQVGRALLGFGLLLLGMETMKDAIAPHKASLEPLLRNIDGARLSGVLLGVGLSALLTAVWQSSGATVGLCFALTAAGAFTRMEQILPVVLGAHIGTCATALLGSFGTNIEARRCAVVHLAFNLFNVTLAIAARSFLYRLLPMTSSDLIRQTANLHTIVMTVGAIPILPLAKPFASLVRFIVHSRKPLPEKTFLDPDALPVPEKAIQSAIRELQRIAAIAGKSFRLTAAVMLLHYRRGDVRTIRQNEQVINEIKRAMRDYLERMTEWRLSRRQTIFIQHVDRCMIEIERIGDHIQSVAALSLQRERHGRARFGSDVQRMLLELHESARSTLKLVTRSFDVDPADFAAGAESILSQRLNHVGLSAEAKHVFARSTSLHKMPAIAGVYLAEYVAAFDRLVDHARTIAVLEQRSDFRLKPEKLDTVVEAALAQPPPETADPAELLKSPRE